RAGGTTIFISSHLLSEVEQVADWIIVLRNGHLLFQGPMAELLKLRTERLIAVAENPDDLARLAAIAGQAGFTTSRLDEHLEIDAPRAFAGELNRQAMAAGITLVELGQMRA